MKKVILASLALAVTLAFAGCGGTDFEKTPAEDRDEMYQVSLLQGLTLGDYYGSITVEELKQHGDVGIGTFDGLNGELIMVDGVVYRAAGDGSVTVVPDDETIPFSNVTFMDADVTKELVGISDYAALCDILNEIVEERGTNRFYMIRIDGTFEEMNVRSEYAQEEPYEPLVDVLERDQTFFDYTNVEGTLVGLYCPPYLSDLNAVGWHLHFVSKDKTQGGHVLGLRLEKATLTWDDTDAFRMVLPQNEMFAGFDLTVDQTEDIKKVETKQDH
jgi:acetolactate decarboxylase